MMSEVAVQGCTFTASIPELTGSLISYNITPPSPSEINFAEDKGIYFGEITVTIDSGVTATLTGYTTVTPTASPVNIKIQGTAGNMLELSGLTEDKAVQKGDKGTGTLNFEAVPSGSTSAVAVAVPVTVEVTSAGQTTVIAS